ncbi:hypothetical protein AVEN_131955-1 [Araneus ventricosus]|uniref:Uncharacterized protein n=1 Tax=Araneus ventricosus TaxID=182803 RepID=A0A4Y2B1L5_ARAVE|nr:hypothetical protein AVEN_131955-1 [Araneus ventricosus]
MKLAKREENALLRVKEQENTRNKVHCSSEIPGNCMDSLEKSSGIQNFFNQPGPLSTYNPDVSGRCGLVVRCQLRSRKVPDFKPDSAEDPSCIGPVAH